MLLITKTNNNKQDNVQYGQVYAVVIIFLSNRMNENHIQIAVKSIAVMLNARAKSHHKCCVSVVNQP